MRNKALNDIIKNYISQNPENGIFNKLLVDLDDVIDKEPLISRTNLTKLEEGQKVKILGNNYIDIENISIKGEATWDLLGLGLKVGNWVFFSYTTENTTESIVINGNGCDVSWIGTREFIDNGSSLLTASYLIQVTNAGVANFTITTESAITLKRFLLLPFLGTRGPEKVPGGYSVIENGKYVYYNPISLQKWSVNQNAVIDGDHAQLIDDDDYIQSRFPFKKNTKYAIKFNYFLIGYPDPIPENNNAIVNFYINDGDPTQINLSYVETPSPYPNEIIVTSGSGDAEGEFNLRIKKMSSSGFEAMSLTVDFGPYISIREVIEDTKLLAFVTDVVNEEVFQDNTPCQYGLGYIREVDKFVYKPVQYDPINDCLIEAPKELTFRISNDSDNDPFVEVLKDEFNTGGITSLYLSDGTYLITFNNNSIMDDDKSIVNGVSKTLSIDVGSTLITATVTKQSSNSLMVLVQQLSNDGGTIMTDGIDGALLNEIFTIKMYKK
jgi:hypothetical protein